MRHSLILGLLKLETGFLLCYAVYVVECNAEPISCFVGTPENWKFQHCQSNRVVESRFKRQSEISVPVINASIAQNFTESNETVYDSISSQPAAKEVRTNNTPSLVHYLTSNITTVSPISNLQLNGTREATACLAFTLSQANNGTHPLVFFDCDYEGICEGEYKSRFVNKRNVTYRGLIGNAYCCMGVGCNRNHPLFPARTPPKPEPLRCLSPSGLGFESVVCPNGTLACLNETTASTPHQYYGCDTDNFSICAGHNIWKEECFRLSPVDGQVSTFCCCFHDDCNGQVPSPSVVSVKNSQGDTFYGMRWILYGWSGFAGVAMMAVTIALLMRWQRRKYRSVISVVNDPRYQRLTANFVAGDTEDVKMLLADQES